MTAPERYVWGGEGDRFDCSGLLNPPQWNYTDGQGRRWVFTLGRGWRIHPLAPRSMFDHFRRPSK